MIAIAACLIQIVQYCDHCFSQGLEFMHQVHEFNLMINIEIRRRLIEQHNRRILDEYHCQKCALALAA
ncbi:hypothetical protein CCR68_23380 [Salmonella enterica]|nr:hypothetical protein [Salmonella enterica]